MQTPEDFINFKDSEGNTPLHFACIGGYGGVGELLLRCGANHEAVNFLESASPLHLAVKQGHFSTVQLLLMWGAVTDVRDGKQRTPLHRYIKVTYLFVFNMRKKYLQNTLLLHGKTPIRINICFMSLLPIDLWVYGREITCNL